MVRCPRIVPILLHNQQSTYVRFCKLEGYPQPPNKITQCLHTSIHDLCLDSKVSFWANQTHISPNVTSLGVILSRVFFTFHQDHNPKEPVNCRCPLPNKVQKDGGALAGLDQCIKRQPSDSSQGHMARLGASSLLGALQEATDG